MSLTLILVVVLLVVALGGGGWGYNAGYGYAPFGGLVGLFLVVLLVLYLTGQVRLH